MGMVMAKKGKKKRMGNIFNKKTCKSKNHSDKKVCNEDVDEEDGNDELLAVEPGSERGRPEVKEWIA